MRPALRVDWLSPLNGLHDDRAVQDALRSAGVQLRVLAPRTEASEPDVLRVIARGGDWHPSPQPCLTLADHPDEEAALLARMPAHHDVLRRPVLVEALLARLVRLAERSGVATSNSAQPVLQHDELTPCLAASGWSAQVHHQLELPRHGGVAALVLIGLDHFGRINRDLGHAVGDRLLQQQVIRWQPQLAMGDRLGRLQGDCFGIFLRRYDVATLRRDVELLRQDTDSRVHASAGLAWVQPGDAFGGLMAQADTALQRAKTMGRNRTQEAGPPPAAVRGAQRRAVADFEALTQGGNRAYLEERLTRHAEQAARALSLILVDPQGLGGYNQTHGREAGDRLLQAMAAQLRLHARLSDWVARPSGGALALVLPDTDAVGADVLADRLRTAMGGTPISVRLLARTRAPDQDPMAWLADAEAAMARVKHEA